MQEEDSTYNFERDCKLALEQINQFALSQIKVLKDKYFSSGATSMHQTESKPSYKIIWNHPDPRNSIYAFYTIITEHPVIEDIDFSLFESLFKIKHSLTHVNVLSQIVIYPTQLNSLIFLLEAFRITELTPLGQFPHIIIPSLFRQDNNKPFKKRSIITTSNEIKKEINNWGSDKNTLNEKIIAVLGKKFTGNLPELRLIFGK